MFTYILRRAALIVPTFFGVTLLAFALIHLIPGDPVENLSGERGMAPERRERLLHEYGLDRSLAVQYAVYVRQIFKGDLGSSLTTHEPVLDEFLTLFPATVELSLFAMLLAVCVGLPAGIVAALFVLPVARLIMGPIPGLSFRNAPLLLVVTVLGGAAFSAMGLYLGTGIAPQQIGLMFSVIVAPMIMFGCTYYPWTGLSHVPVMKWLVLINPLVYVSEGMRAALTPAVPHMPVPLILGALVILTVLFMFMGLRAFDKRAMS